MRTVVSVVGARPQFVKLAPVARALAARTGWRHRIVHTGQHYDHEMSGLFFEELQIPRPDVDLGVGSGSHGRQTGAMLAALEAELASGDPDAVLTYGDTNSTLAATLAAAKLHVPVCHVEAGLRSFDRTMPEEVNRIVADHCGDRLYAPTPLAMGNLEREGLGPRAVWSGDVMLDAVRHNLELARNRDVVARHGLEPGAYGIVTIHRQSNTTPDELAALLSVLEEVGARLPLLFPMHPRTRAALGDRAAAGLAEGLRVVEPLGHLDMLRALADARLVLTDSGGLQKEAAFVGTPCVTLRDTTEWSETVEMGANVLAGRSPGRVRAAVERAMGASPASWSGAIRAGYGDGDAAGRIVEDLEGWLGARAS